MAGYARWQSFLAHLDGYARARNDPLRDGVSRMSAWLHWGHVSPLRIAREAAGRGGDGADKYLDELLVWRELAYAWCFHTRDAHDPECLPAWARSTLREHESDPRPLLPSWETLVHARTGDALWDACQRSLLRHGELHNNLRMTWGKALVGWTRDVEQAMERLADLNHRYALDGRDPASYGGLWWCLGLFDRPFQPEQRILGSVRPRPTREHARRLDVDRYAAKVDRPRHAPLRFQLGMGTVSTAKVAVIGAGLGGLACASALREQGLRVDVFDKARGFGGRTSTRRIEDGAVSVDHGAQYFTARDPRFRTRVASWIEDGVVAEWDARVVTLDQGRIGADPRPGPRLVGTPAMSALCRHLGARVGDVHFGARIVSVTRDDSSWSLHSETGARWDGYDFLVVALPAPQAAELVADADPEAGAFAAGVAMTPCLACWLVFDAPFDVPFDAAFCASGDDLGRPLAWAARNSSKPGRDRSRDVWVLHGTPAWSARLLEEDPAAAGLVLAEALARESGRTLPRIVAQGAHRWRYALPPTPAPQDHWFDAARGLALCGDWCGGPRVEGAWLSGCAAAGAVLRHLNLRRPS
ncbi:MAG: NAD(P)-binding protein [Myxococcales bacterium]|nr:NAD(P)-binding protein [Myxococcales bacterium]